MTIRTQPRFTQCVFTIIGILLICIALSILVYDIYTYVRQYDQRDWDTATATVIEVQEKTHNIKGPDAATYYYIVYQYAVLF